MPRRRPTDSSGGEPPAKAARVRKKKESAVSICSTPNNAFDGMKMEPGAMNAMMGGGGGPPPGVFDPSSAGGGSCGMVLPHGMMPPHHHPNNGGMIPGAGGPMLGHPMPGGGPPEDGSGPYGSGGPHPDYYFHPHHPAGGVMPPHHQIPPPPMYGGNGGGAPPPPLPPLPPHHHHHPGTAGLPGPPQQQPLPPFEMDQGAGTPGACPPQPMPPGGVPHPPPFMYSHTPVGVPPPQGMPGTPSQNGPHVPPPPHLPPNGPSQPHPGGATPAFMMRQVPMVPFGPNFPQAPYFEHRLQEMNRRLIQFHNSQSTFTPQDHAQWWEAFAYEFFDDDARMTISMFDPADMTNRKYTIGRSLIPRFYRTIFENGVLEMLFTMRSAPHERFHPQQWGLTALDCDNVLMLTTYDRPLRFEAHTDCKLFIEFAPYEDALGFRFRHWAMELRRSQEYFPLLAGCMDNQVHELMKSGVSRCGLPQQLLHYLKLCLILEPMQIIMHHSKVTSIPPRESMNQILFSKHTAMQNNAQQQRLAQQQQPPQQQLPPHMMNNPGAPLSQASLPVPQTPAVDDTTGSGGGGKKQPRKRQRKNAANGGVSTPSATGGASTSPSKKKNTAAAAATATPPPVIPQPSHTPQQPQMVGGGPPPQVGLPPQQLTGGLPPNFPPNHGMFNPVTYNDVLIVGEPSMMGCEYAEEDERAISRIENTQYVEPNSNNNNKNPQQQGPSNNNMSPNRGPSGPGSGGGLQPPPPIPSSSSGGAGGGGQVPPFPSTVGLSSTSEMAMGSGNNSNPTTMAGGEASFVPQQ